MILLVILGGGEKQPPPPVGQGLLLHASSRSTTTTHHSRKDFSGRVISSSQRPLPDNTQHSQQTNTPAPGGIRTHNLSRRAAVELRLRPRGHWDQPYGDNVSKIWILLCGTTATYQAYVHVAIRRNYHHYVMIRHK